MSSLVDSMSGLSELQGKLRAALDAGAWVGFDTETFGPEFKHKGKSKPDATRHRVAGYSFAFVDGSRYYVPLAHPAPMPGAGSEFHRVARRLLNFLKQPAARVWAHNWKFDLMVLENEGVRVKCQLLDSELAAWMVGWKLPGKGGLKLKPLAEKRLGYRGPTFEEVAKGRAVNTVPAAEVAPYAANDAALTLQLGAKAWPRLKQLDLMRHWAIEQRCIPVTAHMERTGVPLDRAKLEAAAVACEEELAAVEARFVALTRTTLDLPVKVREPKPCPVCGATYLEEGCPGERGKVCVGGVLHHKNGKPVMHSVTRTAPTVAGCPPGSDAKVSRWLFRELGWWRPLPKHPTVEYGPSVKADFIRRYAAQDGPGGEAARLRLRFQALRKYATTYTRTLIALADQAGDGRLHTSYKQDGTDTSRYSSSMPNQSNLPKSARQDLPWLSNLPDIRDAFVTEPGWEISIFDYSQIELRLVAHYSRDPIMLAAFRSGGVDMHTATQQRLGGACDRTSAKIVNFSTIYRIQPRSLASKLSLATNDFSWTPGRAGRAIEAFYELYTQVPEYHDRAVAAAERRGYASTLTGFKRPIGPWRGPSRWGSENRAINTPIQGSAGGILKLALAELHEAWASAGMLGRDVRIMGQTYDEIIVENRVERGDAVRETMQRVMEGVGATLNLRVPLVAEGGSGASWSAAK